ncbi:hypothetical protein NX774_22180 [Massilia agilis]|uniref:DUF1640 domain-containing protein n=1 Tax=Massilia agilis TaxID=1811226 RepID=A0ABT2DH44_9BURK|nr:hypothetical protein [Massilia agilis]MCS0810640.1 hypothetical protein [Massilia agilis]
MTNHFNALDYAHQLEAVGVPTAQAEAHAQAMAGVLEKCLSAAMDNARLKSELEFKISEVAVTLRAEIKELEARLTGEMKELEARLTAQVNEFEVRITAKIEKDLAICRADLERRIDRLEAKMNARFRAQWWANGVMVAMLVGLYFR